MVTADIGLGVAGVLGSFITAFGLVVIAVIGRHNGKQSKEAVRQLTSPNSGSFREEMIKRFDNLDTRFNNVDQRMAVFEVNRQEAVKVAAEALRLLADHVGQHHEDA
jgi:hypothetical protein